MLELLTPRLRLRQISVTDWPLFVRLHQEHDIIRYVFDEPSLEEITAKFRVLLPAWQARPRQWLCLIVCCITSGTPLGTMAFIITDAKHNSAEFGYMFLPEHFGKGYATEALLATKQFAFSLGLTQLQATVTEGNTGSCRVLEKCGFVLSKRIEQAYSINNTLYDDLIYTCHNDEPAIPVAE
ncbi:GNAT family N-acetyltransferase [Rheinheimera pacifica]|uniref:GNAT family N-acetyltransferase n=1 Tax=Rheinheimera pacifica TaxID=173990 RepID=UPI0021698FD9|nr:GNAT family N-acetyltransferase [Rheinheimera pacifica]